jgi:diguanylate cyclase (GGDEF)-like protein
VRAAAAVRDYPRTILLGGLTLTFFTVVEMVLPPLLGDSVLWMLILNYTIMAATMLLTGWFMTVRPLQAGTRLALFISVGILMGAGLCLGTVIRPMPISYSILFLLICVLGSTALYWSVYLVQSAAIMAMGAMTLVVTDAAPVRESLLLTLGAVLVGALLLWVRVRSIDEAADASAQVVFLASHDQLTGNLNRHGLFARVPALWADARERGTDVFVVFLDIRRLKQANDRHGHEFGDQVIVAAARAVTAVAGPDYLVGRWGGDEILVVGRGTEADSRALIGRLAARTIWPTEVTARWDGELSVGYAVGDPARQDIDDLIRIADARMYEQRRGSPD